MEFLNYISVNHFSVSKQGEINPNGLYIQANVCSIFLLVMPLLELVISMTNESLYLSQTFPSIFISLAFGLLHKNSIR